jgi:flagellar basal-body rod protein FlgB
MMKSIDSALMLHGDALRLRAARGEVLASNIANADTPRFKARDFNFQKALSAAHGRSRHDANLQLQKTHAAHLDAGDGIGSVEFGYRVPQAPSLDGNTVEADVERAEFAGNAIGYLTSLRILNDRIRGLRGAIKGE